MFAGFGGMMPRTGLCGFPLLEKELAERVYYPLNRHPAKVHTLMSFTV